MINTKTKGELGRRIEYDVEHDLFHPQNIYSDEYITPTFVEYVQELEKENAELKENNKMLEQGYIWHDYDAGEDCYEDSHKGKWVKRNEVYQFTKAKEIIKDFLLMAEVEHLKDRYETVDEAEQFLNEVEK